MKKKSVAMMTAVTVLFGSLALPPSAAEGTEAEKQFPLPFELTAPMHTALTVDKIDGGQRNAGKLLFTWSTNNSITEFFAETNEADEARKEAYDSLGYNTVSISTQLDWALDDQSDWHYSQYYDYYDDDDRSFGYDEDNHYRLGVWDAVNAFFYPQNTINNQWIMEPFSIASTADYTEETLHKHWTGDEYRPGLRDQLKEGQYTMESDYYGCPIFYINYDEHTAYVRARYVVKVQYADDTGWHKKYLYSDWSETAAYGKDAPAWEAYMKESLAAPVITNFYMTNYVFNSYPKVSYTLTVPEEVDRAATEVKGRGGTFEIETYARLKGTEEWFKLWGDSAVRAGEMRENLVAMVTDTVPESKNINRFSQIELRGCYHCYQTETYGHGFLGEFRTEYSPVITFDTTELVNEPTCISVRGVFPAGYKLMVQEKNLTVEDLQKAYELWLEEEDGTKVEIPENAALQVRLPYEDQETRVSYFDENAVETRVNAVYTEGKYVFETNHLGVYGILTRTIGSGDVNEDGDVDVADALMISRYDAGLTELTPQQLAVGDVSGDGAVDIADALMVARFDAGLIQSFG